MEVGGVRLRSQQAKVEGIKEMSDHANDQLTKAEVGRAKAEKDLVKLEKALKNNSAALADLEEELAILEKSIREKAAGLDHLRKNVDEAKSVLEDKSEELAEMKALLDEKNADMNKFRAREVSGHSIDGLAEQLLTLDVRIRLSSSRNWRKPSGSLARMRRR